MSLENAIATLLEQRRTEVLAEDYPGAGSNKEGEPSMQGSSQRASFEVTKNGGTAKGGSANRLAPGVAGKEDAPHKQGSSEVPGWEDLGDSDSADTGKKAADKMSETKNKPLGKGAGETKNFVTKKDPTAEVNKGSSRGNVGEPGRHTFEAIQQMFADETSLTEEFKTKAVGLFEALVVAAIAEQREALEEEVAEAAVAHILEAEEKLNTDVNKYLEFMAEQWIEKNEVAVTNTLKVEMAESFFAGLRDLYESHYITLPEDGGTDVVATLQAQVDELKGELNATIEAGVEATEEVISLRKHAALVEASEGLALTEAEKLVTLCADVSFEDEPTFKEKVAVIRESYFPKTKGKVVAEEKSETVEEVTGEVSETIEDPEMNLYLNAISQSAKSGTF